MSFGIVTPGFEHQVRAAEHRAMLAGRTMLEYQQYEDMFQLPFPCDGGEHIFAQYRTGAFRLSGVSQHRRLYEAV